MCKPRAPILRVGFDSRGRAGPAAQLNERLLDVANEIHGLVAGAGTLAVSSDWPNG